MENKQNIREWPARGMSGSHPDGLFQEILWDQDLSLLLEEGRSLAKTHGQRDVQELRQSFLCGRHKLAMFKDQKEDSQL